MRQSRLHATGASRGGMPGFVGPLIIVKVSRNINKIQLSSRHTLDGKFEAKQSLYNSIVASKFCKARRGTGPLIVAAILALIAPQLNRHK